MNEQEIQEWIGKGFLHVRVIIELLGRPKEHVTEMMSEYIKKIDDSKHMKLISKTVAEPKEQQVANAEVHGKETTMFSTFSEVEFMIKGVSNLIGFCFDYMPASIEVIAPERITFNSQTTTDFVNDLQTKLHRMDAILKQNNSEVVFLKKNLHMTILNLISVALHNKKLSEEELTKITGLSSEGLKTFLEILQKQNRIKLEDSKYSLILP